MGYEQIAIPDDHVLAITGRMVRETREEIEALKRENLDLADLVEFDNKSIVAANTENEKLKHQLSEMQSYKDRWEELAWERLSDLNKASDRVKKLAEDNENLKSRIAKLASFDSEIVKGQNETILKQQALISRLSSALTEQEACAGREILERKSAERWMDVWKRQADDTLAKLNEVVKQASGLKAELKQATESKTFWYEKWTSELVELFDLKKSLAKKQARAKRQTALLKALRKEVGAEAFDKAYQDSLGAEKKKEMTKIADKFLESFRDGANWKIDIATVSSPVSVFYWKGFPS